jgi:hypothetical protein
LLLVCRLPNRAELETATGRLGTEQTFARCPIGRTAAPGAVEERKNGGDRKSCVGKSVQRFEVLFAVSAGISTSLLATTTSIPPLPVRKCYNAYNSYMEDSGEASSFDGS